MTVNICAALTAQDIHQLSSMITQSEQEGASIIEIRMDYLHETPQFEKIRDMTDLPLIATNRSQNEGGVKTINETERIQSLIDAASVGFEYIDLEWRTPRANRICEEIKGFANTQIILSHHDFRASPTLTQLSNIHHKQVKAGADVCKIIFTANTIADNLPCLDFVQQVTKNQRTISFCLGSSGLMSRLFSPLFGGFLTYAAIERGKEAAAGQITLAEMTQFYEMITK
ncbi:MAG: type I 3-dehydroquinate dehydratase [Candidatus Bathyarchaeota archaeon]|nr:type I 3-dehydroquinate dehydratase [Candidatus Bathyarchaeota archaeon]